MRRSWSCDLERPVCGHEERRSRHFVLPLMGEMRTVRAVWRIALRDSLQTTVTVLFACTPSVRAQQVCMHTLICAE